MKRNPYAVQSVDSGWVHGVISHEGRGPHPTAPTPSLAGGPSAKTRGRASDVRPEPVGTFQPAGGHQPSSNPDANTKKRQPRPTLVPVPITPSELKPPPNSGPPGQSVDRGRSLSRGRNASRGSNKSQIRGASVASSTNSRKSRSGVTEGLGDAHYGEFVKQIVNLAIQKNIPRDKLIMEITTIIRNCAKYAMEHIEAQIDEEMATAETQHQQEIHALQQINDTNMQEHTRIVSEREQTIESLHKHMGELMDSTEDLISTNSELGNQLQEANKKIEELEDQNDDLVQQISQSQQEHTELLADVFRKTEVAKDGPAEANTIRFLHLDDHKIKRELPGSPASREHLLRRAESHRAADGPAAGARPQLRRASTLQPRGRGGQNSEPPRWKA